MPTDILEAPVKEKIQDETYNILSKGLGESKPVEVDDAKRIIENLTKGIEKKEEVKPVVKEKKFDTNGKEIVVAPVVETPEQIKLKEQATQIEAIKADLTKSEDEKAKAISELTKVTKPLKHWEVKEETPAESAAPKEETKELEIKAFEAKAREYDEILKDPAVEALITARKAGKNFSEFLKEVAPIDVNKIPLNDLMREQLKRENLSPEAIETEMEAFEGLSERAKIRETKDIKASLQSEQQNRLAKYSLDNKQQEIKAQEWVLNLNKEKEQYLDSIKGKVKEGVEITSARLPELQKEFENFNLRRKDGTLDVPRVMRIILLEKYNSLRLENAYQQGSTEKELEIFTGKDGIVRPSASNGIATIPDNKKQSQKTENEKNLSEFDRLTQIRGKGTRV